MAHDLCWKELNNANLHIVCMPAAGPTTSLYKIHPVCMILTDTEDHGWRSGPVSTCPKEQVMNIT